MSMKEMVKKLEKAAEPDRITITRGDKNKILIDFTGDGGPEAALIDTTGSDVPDLLAIDLTGDHKFNLFLESSSSGPENRTAASFIMIWSGSSRC